MKGEDDGGEREIQNKLREMGSKLIPVTTQMNRQLSL